MFEQGHGNLGGKDPDQGEGGGGESRGEERHRAREAGALVLGQVVEDPDETGVEAQSEDDLEERREEEQEGERAVVLGGEEGEVEGDEEEVDPLGQNIRGPVGEGEPREALQGRDGLFAQTRPSLVMKCSITRSRTPSRSTLGS